MAIVACLMTMGAAFTPAEGQEALPENEFNVTDTLPDTGWDNLEPAGQEAIEPEEEAPRLRDPFWPVGYVPPPKAVDGGEPLAVQPVKPAVEQPDWSAAEELLNYQGRFKSRDVYLASVNGQIVEVGDVIAVRRPPWLYRWRITAIDRNAIKTTRLEVLPAQ